MNKSVYLGQAILDLSKTIMYEFHYDYMKRKYNESDLKLLYMDTDLLVYDIKTEDFHKDIVEDVETRFDTSGYEPDRPLPIGKNKKVIGLMKDELGGKIMKEFISLRPKRYSYRVEESEPKRCKGIKKCVVKKTISFEDYKRCLLEGRNIHRSQLMLRSKKHNVRMLEVNKLALSREDDKRISIDRIDSLASNGTQEFALIPIKIVNPLDSQFKISKILFLSFFFLQRKVNGKFPNPIQMASYIFFYKLFYFPYLLHSLKRSKRFQILRSSIKRTRIVSLNNFSFSS